MARTRSCASVFALWVQLAGQFDVGVVAVDETPFSSLMRSRRTLASEESTGSARFSTLLFPLLEGQAKELIGMGLCGHGEPHSPLLDFAGERACNQRTEHIAKIFSLFSKNI
jgi:hypothetical protein